MPQSTLSCSPTAQVKFYAMPSNVRMPISLNSSSTSKTAENFGATSHISHKPVRKTKNSALKSQKLSSMADSGRPTWSVWSSKLQRKSSICSIAQNKANPKASSKTFMKKRRKTLSSRPTTTPKANSSPHRLRNLPTHYKTSWRMRRTISTC